MTGEREDAKLAAALLGRHGGKIGGRARGPSKRRGDAAYYRELSAKGVAARRKRRRKKAKG